MGRKALELGNKRFGRLYVLHKGGRSKGGDVLWRCLCKCGNITTPTYSSLVSGNTKSCGCLHTEIISNNNRDRKLYLIGRRFGQLTVIRETNEKSKDGHYKWLCGCDCGAELLVIGSRLVKGNTKSCGCYNRERLLGGGETHIGWKGGVVSKNLALYDTYVDKLIDYEEVRKNSEKLLEIKCTYCGKWFHPGGQAVKNRLKALNTNDLAENRFYCSDNCKNACSLFNRRAWPKGFKPATSREVQPQLRQMVLERDNWTCQKCGATEAELHCHHIEPVSQNPIESADVDNCITFCKDCHKEVHQQDGCKYHELKCKE